MLSKINLIVITLFLLITCEKDDDSPTTPEVNNPIVSINSAYDVILDEDVIYAKGLSHNSLNSQESAELDLKLDIYYPDNDDENRPLIMFVHGGGFISGSKQQHRIVDIANYYASRGWVFISIDYRLQNDIGTVPQEWIDYSENIPSQDVEQFFALYPAHRDAKAAMRWIVANKDAYNINEEFITVGGSSAGAIIAITLGISNIEDYKSEININQDQTLTSTNFNETYQIKTIIDFWGSKVALDLLELIYGHQRFDSNDPALFIAHGTEDNLVPFSNAEDLKTIYENNQAPFVYYPLEGEGHSAWDAMVDNNRIEELAFGFIVNQQNLTTE